MNLADRLRQAAAGVGRALGRRPSVELVRVDQPELLAPPRLRALPAPEQPRRSRAGGGYAALYGRSIVSAPGQPQPLGRSWYDPRPLIRDQANPWRTGRPDVSEYGWDKQAMYADLLGIDWEQQERQEEP